MYQIIEQTDKQKMKMYKKIKKKKLIKMLIECNKVIEKIPLTTLTYNGCHDVAKYYEEYDTN